MRLTYLRKDLTNASLNYEFFPVYQTSVTAGIGRIIAYHLHDMGAMVALYPEKIKIS